MTEEPGSSSGATTRGSTLETMVKGLSGNGMTVEFKRQLDNGNYEHATEKDLSLLNSKALLASAAKQIQSLSTDDEKLATALELKVKGNEFYKSGNYEVALQTYLQSLSASDFGGKSTSPSSPNADGNIDSLIVPVLGNMSACCLQLHEYVKVVKFCEQILQLRPNNFKASLRKGISFYYLKEYDLSLTSLNNAKSLINPPVDSDQINDSITSSSTDMYEQREDTSGGTTTTQSLLNIDAADKQKLNYFMSKCLKERQEERDRMKKQKLSLQKAFSSGPYAPPSKSKQTPIVTTIPFYITIINIIYVFLQYMFLSLSKAFKIKPQ